MKLSPDTETAVEIQLTKPAQFSDHTHWKDINRHPDFCATCTNLDPKVAVTLMILQPDRIWHHAVSDAYGVESLYADIVTAAAEGCSSCTLIRACVSTFESEEALQGCDELMIRVEMAKSTALFLSWGGDDEPVGFRNVELFVEQGISVIDTTMIEGIS